ncbi:MAG: WhiB family transcriptional regulator, redox-sensing transcriptional regulator [Actinomycetota bacterium]|nr:WhiB family transcriptional regulator, redox-sensing transcriptional regulator [Actinomycetota bacterium]
MSLTDDRIVNQLLPVERDWREDALCPQTDPDAFFPDKGGSSRPAKQICGRCSVRSACLSYALENGIREGIWGGLSPSERRQYAADNGIDIPEPVWLPDRIAAAAQDASDQRLAG